MYDKKTKVQYCNGLDKSVSATTGISAQSRMTLNTKRTFRLAVLTSSQGDIL